MSGLREQLLEAGLANQRRGQLAAAEQCYRLVLQQSPRDPAALYRMGVLALQCAKAAAAVRLLEAARDVAPFDADAWYNLGMAHVLEYTFEAAQMAFQRALELDGGHSSAAVSLGNVYKLLGCTQAAAKAFLKAVSSSRTDAVLFSQLLVGLHTIPGMDAATVFALHRQWAERFARRHYPARVAFANAPDPEKRLRIGFVSPKLNGDIVGQFLRGVIPPLCALADVHLYHAGRTTDDVTESLAQHAFAWRDIAGLDDDRARALIVADGIDVLVDLAGHAPSHRLLLFARRAAPVQVTWLDYFDTTGLDTMDVIVTDATSTPPELVEGGAQRFVERVMRLPHSRLCFSAPPFAPEVAPAPALRNGRVTFGCFGRADKIGPDVVALWSRVLLATADAALVLKSAGLDAGPVRERIARDFEAHGVARERLAFRGPSSHAGLLAEYADIDVALDTFPYNGGATTCDALWMGVPVVTLPGSAMIARQGASLLAAAGCAEWIANDADGYVAIASTLASDVTALDHTRRALRERVARSPLCDGIAFASDLLAVLRGAWRTWCLDASAGPGTSQQAAA